MNLTHYSNRFDPSLLAVAIVTILAAKVDEKPWEFTDETGKARQGTAYTQKAKLEVMGFAYPFKVKLENPAQAWPVGEYVLDLAAMLGVNKEQANLGKFHVLVPMKAAKVPA
jgi:hypothetical protein